MRLSPLDPALYNMQTGTAFAHLLAGRYDEASSWVEQPFQNDLKYLQAAAVTAASHALADGWTKRGKPCNACARSIPRCAFPTSRIGIPYADPKTSPGGQTGLRKAGLPE